MPVQPTEEEERYFKELEMERRAQLRKKLDKAASQLQDKRKIADTVGTEDLDIVRRIRALGFDGDSARVFDLLPLIHVAWADGSIQRGERAAIFRVLESRNISPDSSAFTLIASLLEERPSEAYMDESLALLRAIVRDRAECCRNIVDLCVTVADASGGFLGLGDKIANEERELIQAIANMLGSQAQAEFKLKLG
jgi:tellurite resistance protein